MLMRDFEKHLRELKKKDEIAIKKANRRLHSVEYDYKFYCKVTDIYDVFMERVEDIITVLKEYIDNPLDELMFGKPFSDTLVRSVLMDKDFVASLMSSNLINRAFKLQKISHGQVKHRVYIAILNYDRYKKENVIPKKKKGNVKKIPTKQVNRM